MLTSFKKGNASRTILLFRIAIVISVIALVSTPELLKSGIAGADSAGSGISCGHDSLCNTLADKEFEMILYSATGSEMVVLFSKNEIGDIVPRVPESYYSRAAGTVKEAIYYLSRNHNYAGFKFRRAKKSTGLFRTEVIKGVYVAVPKYSSSSEHRPPEYRFDEKNGSIRVNIKPVIRPYE